MKKSTSSPAIDSSEKETEMRQQLRVPTWKEATRRRDGSEGYQFGDLMRLTLRRVMEGVAQLRVPLLVELGHGASWAEAH